MQQSELSCVQVLFLSVSGDSENEQTPAGGGAGPPPRGPQADPQCCLTGPAGWPRGAPGPGARPVREAAQEAHGLRPGPGPQPAEGQRAGGSSGVGLPPSLFTTVIILIIMDPDGSDWELRPLRSDE